MYYRLSCILESGLSRGYQWRELDSATFVAVATGTRPQGDAEAQTRDSTDIDSTFTNAPVYYGAVWIPGTGWINDMTQAAAEAVFTACGQEKAGT